jgi:hypothetical protein
MQYIAVLKTWPQVSQDDCALELRTKELSPDDTIGDLMTWVLRFGTDLKNVTITVAD